MPVDQLLEILSSDERYTYMPGSGAQPEPDAILSGIQSMMGGSPVVGGASPMQAQGQSPSGYALGGAMPEGPHIMDNELKKAIPLEDIREARYNVQLEASSESEAYRMAQLRVLLEVLGGSQGGIAVDPEIVLELAAGSRSMRERLLRYQRSAQEAQSQAAQAQAQGQAQLLQAQAGAFQADAQARILGAKSDAMQGDTKLAQERVRDAQQALLDLLTIWERADAAEKPTIQRAGAALAQ
jgi:hypothetical protein